MSVEPAAISREALQRAVQILSDAGIPAAAPARENNQELFAQFSEILKEVAKKVQEVRHHVRGEVPFSQADLAQPTKVIKNETKAEPCECAFERKELKQVEKETAQPKEEVPDSGCENSEHVPQAEQKQVQKPAEAVDDEEVEGDVESEDTQSAQSESEEAVVSEDVQLQNPTPSDSEVEVVEQPEPEAAAVAAAELEETSNEQPQEEAEVKEVTPEQVVAAPLVKEDQKTEQTAVEAEVVAEEALEEEPAPEAKLLKPELPKAQIKEDKAPARELPEESRRPELPKEITERAKAFVAEQAKENANPRAQLTNDSPESEVVPAVQLLLQEAKVAVAERANSLAVLKDPGFLTAQLIRQSIQGVQQQIREVGNASDLTAKVGSAVKAIASNGQANANPQIPNISSSSNAKNDGQAGLSSDKETKPTNVPKRLAFQALERVENVIKEMVKSKEGKSISLRLDPPELGKVKVDLTRTENGLYVRVSADNPQINNMLRDRSSQLHQVLRQAGINSQNLTITVGGENASQETFSEFSQENLDRGSGSKRVLEDNRGEEKGELGQQVAASSRRKATQTMDHWVA